jgi:hypothetical protein
MICGIVDNTIKNINRLFFLFKIIRQRDNIVGFLTILIEAAKDETKSEEYRRLCSRAMDWKEQLCYAHDVLNIHAGSRAFLENTSFLLTFDRLTLIYNC